MAQNNDHTIGFRKLLQGVADGARSLLARDNGVGRGTVTGHGALFVVPNGFVEGEFGPAFELSQFVIA